MRRFFQVFAVDVVARLLLGLVSLALIRFFEPSQYARYTLAVALATAVAQTLAAGFGRIFIVGHGPLNLAGHEGAYLGLQLLLLAVVACVTWPFASAFASVDGAVLVLALGIVTSEFAKTVFQQRLQFPRYSTVEIVRAVLQAAAVAGLLAVYRHATSTRAVVIVQGGALLVACGLALAREMDWRGLVDTRRIAHLAAAILSGRYALLLAYFAVVAVFSQVDVVMLKLVGSEAALASYGAALRYYALLSLALGSVHAVLVPTIQRGQDRGELEALYEQHFRLLALFVPAVAAGAWAARWVLPFVDGGRYPDSVPAFQILAASSVISFAFSPHANVLFALQRFRFLLSVVVVALVLAVALHAWLIPRYGAAGAAMVTLLTAGVANGALYAAARRAHRSGG